MFKRLPFVLCALTAVVVSLAQAQDTAANQPAITGTWEMSWDTPRGPMTATMELKQDGNALTGRVQTRGGWQEIKEGTVDGSSFSFVVELTRQDQTFAIRYSGTLQDDGTLKGTITTPRGENPWTGKRAER
jgi:ABC-type sugar transport system substrate-binding protein